MLNIDLKGKNVWITGASQGIGRACALAFAKAGASVGLGYFRHEKEALAAALECRDLGAHAHCVFMDVSSRNHCQEAYIQVCDNIGPIDILINNAGIIKDDLFLTSEKEDWLSLFEVNVYGTLHCSQLVAKDMLMRRHGKIVNISSAAATKGGRGQAIYAATKGAIESATRSMAVELGRKGITVNCIAPGVIETEMSKSIRDLAPEEILQRQVIKRFGRPDEIASWAVMLSSAYGDFITGQTFHIDGGLKMP
jgi:3-oxoacyl-[acyl-carrier protein] reductase